MSKLIKTINDFKKSLNGKTVSIFGKSYATVALRLAIARRNLGTSLDIVTKVIHHDDKQILMQADIFIDGKHVSTGTAHEIRATTRINQTSYVENCETSAIGRALAMAGLINDSVASAEEVSLAREQSDNKLQSALKSLESIDHEGGYKMWLSNHQATFVNLKENDPLAYQRFLEKFTATRNKLTKNGVLKNVGK
jgi:hypothetical protein|tara:strand:- start:236 stop:820 length:585 start_codon:yes stop_codon:yes gene_type:complete